MAILITGVTGFIGSKLAHRLIDEGQEVYGLARHVSRSALHTVEPVLDRLRFIEGDLGEYYSIRAAIASVAPEVVFHLGALTPVRYSFENPFSYAKINFEGTMNIVHAILEASPRTRLIAASTAEVYGWQPHKPIPENAKFNASSPYGVSKAAADSYIQMASRVYGLNARILRCNNTYGRLKESGFLVEYLISSMLANQTTYVGAPDHIRDYMTVDDHVSAYVAALNIKEDSNLEIFNVSPGNPVSNIELAKKIASIIEFKGKIVAGSYPPGYPIRPLQGDTDYIVLDSSKIRKELGWNPSLSLDEGLLHTINAWRKSLPKDS